MVSSDAMHRSVDSSLVGTKDGTGDLAGEKTIGCVSYLGLSHQFALLLFSSLRAAILAATRELN